MENLKTILRYLLYLIASILLGMGYMRIMIGALSTLKSKWGAFLDGIDELIIVTIGTIDGAIAFVFFGLLDYFFIRKKINLGRHRTLLRIISIIILPAFIIGIHHVIEYELDWI